MNLPSVGHSFILRSIRGLAVAMFVIAACSPVRAANLVWTDNPWGEITIFESGSLATMLFTEATVGSATESNALSYLDTPFLPAEVEAFAESGPDSLTAQARLSIEASNDSGLVVDGMGMLAPQGAAGSGFAEVHAFMLIEVFDPAVIRILELMTSLSAGDFSIELFPSDASGSVTGESLLSFSGESATGWDGSFASYDPGFFLLEMTASAGPALSAGTAFEYRVDIASIASVPEPASVGFLVASGTLFVVIICCNRRRRRVSTLREGPYSRVS